MQWTTLFTAVLGMLAQVFRVAWRRSEAWSGPACSQLSLGCWPKSSGSPGGDLRRAVDQLVHSQLSLRCWPKSSGSPGGNLSCAVDHIVHSCPWDVGPFWRAAWRRSEPCSGPAQRGSGTNKSAQEFARRDIEKLLSSL